MTRTTTTRQQVFLKALGKTGFDLDDLQRVADKAMQAGLPATDGKWSSLGPSIT